MPLGFFGSKGVDGDRAAGAFRVLRVDREDVRASGLKSGDVEVRVRALYLRHNGQRVTIFGLEDKGLR
jgi:hypothetical protein